MRNSFYRIEGFEPPRYAFRLSLQGSFAKTAFEQELPESLYKELQGEGRYLIKQNFSYMPIDYKPYIFLENAAGKPTCLLSHVKVLGAQGDAHALDIEPDFNLKLSRPDDFVRYIQHNIDNWTQASTSLFLWLLWLSTINSRLKK